MSTIEMIPISQVRLLNPRLRNKARFSEIVSNIEAVGLKKPITVSPRPEEPGTYDLVCGQGRLEAFTALQQTSVPAIVRPLPKHDCLIMSITENVTKRRSTSLDLVHELRTQRDKGRTHAQIAAELEMSPSYVSMLLRLVDNGEDVLLRAVDGGHIPIAVAADIATSNDASIQESLTEAYVSKRLSGKALLVARRLVERRRGIGKPGTTPARTRSKCTTEELVQAFQKECRRQKRVAKAARVTEIRLVFVANAVKRLLADEHFLTLLRAERLDTMPEYLAEAVRSAT